MADGAGAAHPEQASNQALGALKTKADAEAYVRDVREKIQPCFGPFPEKTPLNPRVTGTVERDAYSIEKVIFESRPAFSSPRICTCRRGGGRPRRAWSAPAATRPTARRARPTSRSRRDWRGWAMSADLRSHRPGRAAAVPHAAEAVPRFGVGVGEHLYAGNQQFLVGEFFGAWRAWDGIRALDYLLTRPEVDPSTSAITGNSGGGTMTTWLCGVEPRWTMAAPSCFVTTFRRNLENELPADTEQCPPRALALGLDHADFLAAMAPKPVIILAKEKDFFDARGSRRPTRG